MWVSVNFNELSRTICLYTDSNKELYKFLVLGLDIPYFDFNVQSKAVNKLLKSSGQLERSFEDQKVNDYGLQPASFIYFTLSNSFSLNQVMIVTLSLYLLL